MSVTKENKAISLTVTAGLTVTILPDLNHEFLMSTNEVAVGYGINSNALSNIKKRNPNEFIDGKHFATALTVCESGAKISGSDPHNKVYWTKRGIVRLGFFIKSERAKLFRDWAEDLIIDKLDKQTQPYQPLTEVTLPNIRSVKINDRVMYPFKKMADRLGYTNSGSLYQNKIRYAGHFIDFNGLVYCSEEFARLLVLNRTTGSHRKHIKQMQPVLPPNFGQAILWKGGLL